MSKYRKLEKKITVQINKLFDKGHKVDAALLDMALFECSSLAELQKLKDSLPEQPN